MDSRKVISLAFWRLPRREVSHSLGLWPQWATCGLLSSKHLFASSQVPLLLREGGAWLLWAREVPCSWEVRSLFRLRQTRPVWKHRSLSPHGCVQTWPRLMVSFFSFFFSSRVWMVEMTFLHHNWVVDYWLLAYIISAIARRRGKHAKDKWLLCSLRGPLPNELGSCEYLIHLPHEPNLTADSTEARDFQRPSFNCRYHFIPVLRRHLFLHPPTGYPHPIPPPKK